MSEILIDPRYCGPPGYANGGYVAGMLALHLPGIVEVMLRQPTPLNTVLTLAADGTGRMAMRHGQTLIAEAAPAAFDLDVPPPPAYAASVAVAGLHPGLGGHPVPGCYVCGPRHPNGLRIFPGWLPDRDIVSAAWTPSLSLADAAGAVRPEFIWAVLDCPGGFALTRGALIPVLLGKFSVRMLAPVMAAEPHILIGWLIANEGRKYYSGTALFAATGELRACASATWIRLKDLAVLGA